MVNILAIDTTLGACSAAIIENGQVIGYKQEKRLRGHVERLLPMIDELCQAQNFSLNELSHVATTIGPGTFAGVRIGLSAAKGIGLALDIPVIPITTIETFLYEFIENNKNYEGDIIVTIDARRGEVYIQSFSVTRGAVNENTKPEAIKINDAVNRYARKKAIVLGSGASLIEAFYEGSLLNFEQGYDVPNILVLGKIALENIGRARNSDDISPLYLRAPDAKLPKKQEIIFTDE